jgi:nitroreductase
MQVKEAIETRRTVRTFDPDHKMTKKEPEKLLALAMRSPTAFNIQTWRFLVVQDIPLREQVRAASWDQAQVTDASLLIILCADLKAWENQSIRYWRSAAESAQELIIPAIDDHYRGLDLAHRDEVMRSCGIAAQTLMLAATSMGYDSCPMDGFDAEKVGELINLPSDHAICMFVAIGKATGAPPPPHVALAMEEVVIYDSF